MHSIDVAVVGATGAVGEVVVELLAARDFPLRQLYLLASERTAGTSLLFKGQSLQVTDLQDFDFAVVKLVIFVATDAVSAEYLPRAQAAGCLVIDNSQAFADSAPLVVPSVNGELLSAKPELVVNPDSNALLLSTVVKPLYEQWGIDHISVTALQSVSGQGKKAIHELASQTAGLLNSRGAEPKVFTQQIAFNLLPAVGAAGEEGHTLAEWRFIKQMRRLLGDGQLAVNASCVQVPVFYSDSLVVSLNAARAIDSAAVREVFENHTEISVLDDIEHNSYASPVSQATAKETIFVSRIRNDVSRETGVNFWVVADNVRKSAAFNTILIAEELIKSYL
ncbi:MAG: aspartate-semialdehyde dehydrogenase [Cellvibrionaceae bacterium]|nr:aspartate-semialdehyde dehydrogenase [Cellvibrionaceae bacterium]